jgi:hypothetical protein
MVVQVWTVEPLRSLPPESLPWSTTIEVHGGMLDGKVKQLPMMLRCGFHALYHRTHHPWGGRQSYLDTAIGIRHTGSASDAPAGTGAGSRERLCRQGVKPGVAALFCHGKLGHPAGMQDSGRWGSASGTEVNLAATRLLTRSTGSFLHSECTCESADVPQLPNRGTPPTPRLRRSAPGVTRPDQLGRDGDRNGPARRRASRPLRVHPMRPPRQARGAAQLGP